MQGRVSWPASPEREAAEFAANTNFTGAQYCGGGVCEREWQVGERRKASIGIGSVSLVGETGNWMKGIGENGGALVAA